MNSDFNAYSSGPAFPAPHFDLADHEHGMTLRDYFAAKAMQATVQAWISLKIYPHTDLEVAQNAYQIADAMLEARK